jgi:hypothetical protein
MDHALQIFFDLLFFIPVEFQTGQIRELVYQCIIDFHGSGLLSKISLKMASSYKLQASSCRFYPRERFLMMFGWLLAARGL